MNVLGTGHAGGASEAVMETGSGAEQETLLCRFKSCPRSFRLLCLTACYWPENAEEPYALLHKMYFSAVRLCFLCMVTQCLVIFAGPLDIGVVFLAVALLAATLTALPAQYANLQRLSKPAGPITVAMIADSSRLVEPVFCFYLLTCIFFITANFIIHKKIQALLIFSTVTLGQLSLSFYLTFNLVILLADLASYLVLIDHLAEMSKRACLTMVTFCAVRKDIHRRVESNRWVSDAIILPCLFSALALVVIVYDWGSDTETKTLWLAAWGAMLSKEVVVVAAAFWFVATANARVDSITEDLSSAVWLNATAKVNAEDKEADDVSLRYLTHRYSLLVGPDGQDEFTRISGLTHCDPEKERLAVCMAAVCDPISMTLLSKRICWTDVYLAASGFFISFIVGLIQSYSSLDSNSV